MNSLNELASSVREFIMDPDQPPMLRNELINCIFKLRDRLSPEQAAYVDAIECEAIILQIGVFSSISQPLLPIDCRNQYERRSRGEDNE